MSDWLSYSEDNPLLYTQSRFWVLFLLLILVYQFIYKRSFVKIVVLCGFSFFFYYLCGGLLSGVLVFSIVINFLVGKSIDYFSMQKARYFFLLMGVLQNIAVLFYFKYVGLIIGAINEVFSSNFVATNNPFCWESLWSDQVCGFEEIVLPVGISFYTFQAISYIVDVYRKRIPAVDNIIDFSFYLSFFPQLVAGPIVRANEFIPQIRKPFDLTQKEFGSAIFLILMGMFKKIIISDFIAVQLVRKVYASPLSYTGEEVLLAVYGYAFQLYYDFSSYTDIALGMALLLGFRLTENFNRPYLAENITQFWQRWHISLSTWLKDYLYIPLGGNRHGKSRMILSLMLTMLLGGMWHGASFNYIVWGGVHGLALVFHKLWSSRFRSKTKSWWVKIIDQVITFHFVAICWVFFTLSSWQEVLDVYSQIANIRGFSVLLPLCQHYYVVLWVLLLAILLHLSPLSLKKTLTDIFVSMPDFGKAVVVALLILFILQAGGYDIGFTYLRF